MDNALRPYLTAGIAVLGAGAIAVTPVAPQISAMQHGQGDAIAASVELTSGVVDTWIDAFEGSAGFFRQFLADFPGQVLASGQLPSITVDLLGQLVGTPDVFNSPPSLFSGVVGPLIVALGQTLPAPLGAGDGGDGLFINAMGGVNALLQSFWATGSGLNDLGSLIPNVADWVEAAPGQLLSAAATGIAHPDDIPGLATYLLHSVFGGSPDLVQTPSLISSMTGPLTVALTEVLPAPLGGEDGLFLGGMLGINSVIEKTFDLLPAAVSPIGLSDLTSLPTDFLSFGELGTNIGDLLGNIPLVGDAFDWLIGAIMALF